MIDINFEFVKGILFVRLEGELTNINYNNIEENVISIIRNGGIKYLVLNVTNLSIIKNVSLFDNCNKAIKENNGMMYICGLKKDLKKVLTCNYNCCNKIKNEISVFRMQRLC